MKEESETALEGAGLFPRADLIATFCGRFECRKQPSLVDGG